MKITRRATAINIVNPAIFDDIGVQGKLGFGVGVASVVPADITPMPGYTDPSSDNYGNYMTQSGSQRVYIPAYWYRMAHASNLTYAQYLLNSVDIKKLSTFANETAANAAGYAMHRMFWDGGVRQNGVFVDKYACSNLNGVAVSVKGGKPISTSVMHNPISSLNGTPENAYYTAIAAAKASSIGAFCNSRFIRAGISFISLAHGQASTSATYCAWWKGSGLTFNNNPRGNNNNAFSDYDNVYNATTNPNGVKYTSDGYVSGNSALVGSGVPFAKTTHNGQACGIECQGNMYEIELGLTCIATGKAITGVALTNPCQITVVGHGKTTGTMAQIESIVGTTQLNSRIYTVTAVDTDTLSLDGVDASAYTAYTSGGSLTSGTFYTLKPSSSLKSLTGGNTLATDQWGLTGVTAHSQAIAMPFSTAAADNSFSQRFGDGGNQVFSGALSGDAWLLSGLGFPIDGSGVSSAGSALMGNDYFHQYIKNELCILSVLFWGYASAAGVRSVFLGASHPGSVAAVSFRAACYPV